MTRTGTRPVLATLTGKSTNRTWMVRSPPAWSAVEGHTSPAEKEPSLAPSSATPGSIGRPTLRTRASRGPYCGTLRIRTGVPRAIPEDAEVTCRSSNPTATWPELSSTCSVIVAVLPLAATSRHWKVAPRLATSLPGHRIDRSGFPCRANHPSRSHLLGTPYGNSALRSTIAERTGLSDAESVTIVNDPPIVAM